MIPIPCHYEKLTLHELNAFNVLLSTNLHHKNPKQKQLKANDVYTMKHMEHEQKVAQKTLK